MHRRYLVLISLSGKDPQFGKTVLAALKRDIDPKAAPHWIDSQGVGLFVWSPKTAREVWAACFPTEQGSSQRLALKDMLVLEVGSQCLGLPDTKAMAWLNSHPAPAPST